MKRELIINLSKFSKGESIKTIELIGYLLNECNFSIQEDYKDLKLNELSINKLQIKLPNFNTNFMVEKAVFDNTTNEIIFTITNEYKENRIIPRTTIKEDFIKISTPDTLLAEASLIKVDFKDLLNKYKEILSLCRSKGIKIKYNMHYKKQLEELKKLYNEAYKEYESIFIIYKNLWIKKIQKGLYKGLLYDPEYKEIEEYSKKLQLLNYNIEGNVYSNSIQLVATIKDILYKVTNMDIVSISL